MRLRAFPLAAGMAAALAIASPAAAAPGSLDASFGDQGKLSIDAGAGNDSINAAAIQPDGKIVLAGLADSSATAPADLDMLVARINANGTPDLSFGGGDGEVAIEFIEGGTQFDTANDVAIAPDGTIYVVGQTDPVAPLEGIGNFAVVRLTPDGQLDPGFSGDGKQTHSIGFSDSALGAVVQSDGKLVIAGLGGTGLTLLRFETDGDLDLLFGGGDGIVETPVGGGGPDSASDIVLLSDDRLVVGGTADQSSGPPTDFVVARYLPNGTIDPDFGDGGFKVVPGPLQETASSLALAPDGEIVLAGGSGEAGIVRSLVVRFTKDGDLDVTFSGDGRQTIEFTGTDGTRFAAIDDVIVDNVGRVLTAGYMFNCQGEGCADFALTRLTKDGEPDPSFGDGGKVRQPFGDLNDFAREILLQAFPELGERALVAGVTFDGTFEQGAVAAFDIGSGTGAKPPGTPSGPAIDHYRVELKAWIPHEVVVDPAHPFKLPFVVGFLGNDCFDPGIVSRDFRTHVTSLFNGNAHVPYDGTFKGFVAAEFDWDGSKITNFSESKQFGPTMRFLDYDVEDAVSGKSRTVRCTIQTGQATKEASAEKVGANAVKQRIATNIPLLALAPPIDDQLLSVVAGAPPESALNLSYDSDLFPSHGFRVYKNGVLQATETISDASCLSQADVLGSGGALRIGWGLTHYDKHGSYAVGPRDVGRVGSQPSLLCDAAYLILQAVDLATAINAQFSAAPSLSIAAVDANGKRGPWLTAAVASARGLVQIQRDGDRVSVFSRSGTPVAVRVRGRQPAVVVTEPAAAGRPARTRLYRGAKRELIATQGSKVAVASGKRALRAGAVDRRPPTTRATVVGRGARVRVSLRARDASGVAAVNAFLRGKRLRLDRRGTVRVKRTDLPRLRFGSVDVFGNQEPLRAARARR